MLLPRSRVFAVSQQITQHILSGTRNGPLPAYFTRSSYSTKKATVDSIDTVISWTRHEAETLPPPKSLKANMVPMANHEIPPLPEKVLRPSYPSPHLTVDQVREYLNPLYSRGWGIQIVETKGPSLSLDLEFSKFQLLCAFLPLLNEVMRKARVSNLVYNSLGLIRL